MIRSKQIHASMLYLGTLISFFALPPSLFVSKHMQRERERENEALKGQNDEMRAHVRDGCAEFGVPDPHYPPIRQRESREGVF